LFKVIAKSKPLCTEVGR